MDSLRHVPQRMCAGCGQRTAKEGLVRFVACNPGPELKDGARGQIVLDPEGKGDGRGAYVCRRLECFDAAMGKRGSLQRRLGGASPEPDLRDKFLRLIGEC